MCRCRSMHTCLCMNSHVQVCISMSISTVLCRCFCSTSIAFIMKQILHFACRIVQ